MIGLRHLFFVGNILNENENFQGHICLSCNKQAVKVKEQAKGMDGKSDVSDSTPLGGNTWLYKGHCVFEF